MKRYILTGTPGAGKTVILRQLELDGFGVVEEAATDLIALWQSRGIDQPWMESWFVDAIAALQAQRQVRAANLPDSIQFHDRSVFCTAALAAFLGTPVTPGLAREIERVHREAIFENRVFFIRSLGFVVPSAARRISHQEALRFEKIHEEIYREFGFDIVPIEPGSVVERARAIADAACADTRM
ncbi:MAG TPA: AAA family ATPase [Terracidiphilus sp.]|nr:AAA family ATPase [Terracidiphilus sp.]